MVPIMKRPSDTRLLAMVQYIRSLDLQVSGPITNFRNGEVTPGTMDFTPRQVVTYRKMKEDKKLHKLSDDEMTKRKRESIPSMIIYDVGIKT
jgi:hypothetical protein